MAAASQAAPGASTIEALLSYAKQNKHLEIQRIVDEGVLDISSGDHDHTALHAACGQGSVAAAQCLIANKAQVNKRNGFSGGTPLHMAVFSGEPVEGRLECAKQLLEAGCEKATAPEPYSPAS